MKKALLLAAATMLMVSSTHAAEWNWDWNERFSYADSEEKFRANEFSIDIFSSYARGSDNVSDIFDEPEDGDWGGGLGVNYFFTKFIGVGADVSAHDNDGLFVDNASASVIVRFPIETVSLAPYIFGGGGHLFENDEWEAHAGAGLEFRLNPHTGIFADARYFWGDDDSEGNQVRAGLRFAF